MTAQYTLSTFTPGEAEAITGVSTTLQRDWRRREFLPKGDGHARFDVFALAEMLTLKLLADRGIGPQLAKDVSDWCAIGMAWEALRSKDAYEGDHERTYDWQPEEFRPKRELAPDALAAMEKAAAEVAGHPVDLSFFDPGWGEKALWLRKQVLRLRGHGRVIPAPVFIWWADGSHTWRETVQAAFGDLLFNDPRAAGAIIVLDLSALAETLRARAGRPFVHVEFPADEAGEIDSPIEYGVTVPLSFGKADQISVETTPTLPQKDSPE